MYNYRIDPETGRTRFAIFRFMAYFRAERIMRRRNEIVVVTNLNEKTKKCVKLN